MTSSDHQYSADDRFERLLIDSAQRDELPSNVDAAWNRFGSALNGVSVLAAGAGGALAVRRAQRWLAAKWLIWGALTGSALTALSLLPGHEQRAETPTVPAAASALPVLASSTPTAHLKAEAQPPAAAVATTTHRRPPHPPSLRPSASAARSEPAPSASSTLAAQVALLDAARTAMAAGAFAEALRLSDRYRADFPNGELAPEAEVVAIEALLERGARKLALERAARFLARYPGDPHTVRVKWLVR